MRLAGDAARGQVVAGRGGAAGAEREVVFARAALVGMAFDGDARSCVYWLSHCAWRSSVCLRVGADRPSESVSKKMRSPTLTVKSCAEPGVAAPAPPRPRSAALLGVFLEAQPAIASASDQRDHHRIRGQCCDAAHARLSLRIRVNSLNIQ